MPTGLRNDRTSILCLDSAISNGRTARTVWPLLRGSGHRCVFPSFLREYQRHPAFFWGRR